MGKNYDSPKARRNLRVSRLASSPISSVTVHNAPIKSGQLSAANGRGTGPRRVGPRFLHGKKHRKNGFGTSSEEAVVAGVRSQIQQKDERGAILVMLLGFSRLFQSARDHEKRSKRSKSSQREAEEGGVTVGGDCRPTRPLFQQARRPAKS